MDIYLLVLLGVLSYNTIQKTAISQVHFDINQIETNTNLGIRNTSNYK